MIISCLTNHLTLVVSSLTTNSGRYLSSYLSSNLSWPGITLEDEVWRVLPRHGNARLTVRTSANEKAHPSQHTCWKYNGWVYGRLHIIDFSLFHPQVTTVVMIYAGCLPWIKAASAVYRLMEILCISNDNCCNYWPAYLLFTIIAPIINHHDYIHDQPLLTLNFIVWRELTTGTAPNPKLGANAARAHPSLQAGWSFVELPWPLASDVATWHQRCCLNATPGDP